MTDNPDNQYNNFAKLFETVFDINNNYAVRAVGRQKCKELIKSAFQIEYDNYGNMDTGCMNTENLSALYKRIS